MKPVQCPPLHKNILQAIQRDYPSIARDPSTDVFLRSALFGLLAQAGPKSLRLVITTLVFVYRKQRPGVSKLNVLSTFPSRFLKIWTHALSPTGLAWFFAIGLGFAKYLERIVHPILLRLFAQPNSKDGKPMLQDTVRAKRIRRGATFVSSMIATLLAMMLLQQAPNRKRRLSTPIEDLPIVSIGTARVTNRAQKSSPTLDLTLFVLVRAVDIFVRGIWRKSPAFITKHKRGAFMAEHIHTAVFVVSCWRIMWAWLYMPQLLPSSYNAWIHNLGQVDKRLLKLLTYHRVGALKYRQAPLTKRAADIGPAIAKSAGFPPEAGMTQIIDKIPCAFVHGYTKTDNCELNIFMRWFNNFAQAMAIYLPVHFLPILLFRWRSAKAKPFETLLHGLRGAGRSSSFLATFVSLMIYGICFGRSRLSTITKPYLSQDWWDSGAAMQIGCIACGFSVLLENVHRRRELALFVAPRAIYATLDFVLPKAAFKPGFATWAERAIFSLSSATVTTAAVHRPDLCYGLVRGVMKFLIGEWGGQAIKRIDTPISPSKKRG